MAVIGKIFFLRYFTIRLHYKDSLDVDGQQWQGVVIHFFISSMQFIFINFPKAICTQHASV